jgi:hypothetical protein
MMAAVEFMQWNTKYTEKGGQLLFQTVLIFWMNLKLLLPIARSENCMDNSEFALG